MANIQLLVTDDSNRRALSTLVADRHDPVVAESLQDADAYLVEDRAFPQYRDDLAAVKDEHHPVFTPVVLIHREATRISIDLPPPEEVEPPRLVNEVLAAPVEQAVLDRRLRNLLARRKQTIELREKTIRLEQFASKLSHELRNPLTSLDGNLTLAQETGAPEYFQKCERSIDRMDRMIDDILLLAREGDVDPELEQIALADVVETCWESVEEPAADCSIETDRHVAAERDLLCELLENLFRNAVEHGSTSPDSQAHQDAVEHGSTSPDSTSRRDAGSDASEPSVADAPEDSEGRSPSGSRTQSDDAVTVIVGDLEDGFYVKDDGVGIPIAKRETVFERGYSTAGNGTGFGLPIVAEIAEALGWEIRVTESDDGGARFEFRGVSPRDLVD